MVYMFPGQGSQKKGMGAGLFEKYKELGDKASNILGYSIENLCLSDPDNRLNQTQYTQPAIYFVNVMEYLERITILKQKPIYVIGHSLGEYNALFAAGAYDFETGLRLVKRRSELMGEAIGGAMAAVIGLLEMKGLLY